MKSEYMQSFRARISTNASKVRLAGLTKNDAHASIHFRVQFRLKPASMRVLRWFKRLTKKIRLELRSKSLHISTFHFHAFENIIFIKHRKMIFRQNVRERLIANDCSLKLKLAVRSEKAFFSR